MNDHRRKYYAWGVLAVGVMIMTALPETSLLSHIAAQYFTNHWIRFLAYALLVSIPCASWGVKKCIMCCLFAVCFSITCGLLYTPAAGPSVSPQIILPNLFGVAAGILLGLNLRYTRKSASAVAGITQERSRSTIS